MTLDQQRQKDEQMMRRTPFPILPPTLNLADTCAQARSQGSKAGGTFMVLNMKKLKEVSGPSSLPQALTPQPDD